MNKSQLIEKLAERFDGDKKAAGHAVDSVLDLLQRTVAGGERVVLTGFGAFEKVDRPARMGRNPATGEAVRVKKTSVPRFKAGTEFKAYVSGAKKFAKTAAPAKAASAGTRSARGTAAKAAPATRGRAAAKATPARATATKAATKTTTRSTTTRATAAKAGAAKATGRSTSRATTAKKAPARGAGRRG